MVRKLIKHLNEPFPDRKSLKQTVLDMLGVGLFIAFALYVFQPFNLWRVEQGIFLICVGFGLVTVLFGSVYALFFALVLKVRTDVPSWTLWKWVVQCIGMLIWIAMGNFLFAQLADLSSGNQWLIFFHMLRNTFLLGIIPVLISGLLAQLRAVKANARQASEIEMRDRNALMQEGNAPQAWVFELSNDESLRVRQRDLRYIEAMQNYVAIHYFDDHKGLQTALIRSTVANVETRLHDSDVIRCHRSYLVNLNAVTQVDGNAQGLKLMLDDVPDFTVPVSRRYIPTLKEKLS